VNLNYIGDLYLFLLTFQLPGKKGHGENGWAIQAKVEVRFWLGLIKDKSEYLKDAPSGFEIVCITIVLNSHDSFSLKSGFM